MIRDLKKHRKTKIITKPHDDIMQLLTYYRKSLKAFHRDERGVMSIVTLLTVLMLAFMLGMILNVCFQADGKIRMQNSADAATYSSGVVMARGMNSLAFTNHLLCDVFALTAFLREGKNNDAEQLAQEILSTWEKNAPALAGGVDNWDGNYDRIPNVSGGNFKNAGIDAALATKVPQQREMVTAFSNWARSFSAQVLPTLETILDQELIPQFQRALRGNIGQMVQQSAVDISTRHGNRDDGGTDAARGQMGAAIWRTDATQFRSETTDPNSPPVGLPVVDATDNPGGFYHQTALSQRKDLAETYLAQWNNEKLQEFSHVGPLSQFGNLWRGFTRGELRDLLAEHQQTNLLHVIWTPPEVQYSSTSEDLRPTLSFDWQQFTSPDMIPEDRSRNGFLNEQYMFVGTVYWQRLHALLPRLFANPLAGDRVNFSQGMLFLAVPRLARGHSECCETIEPTYRNDKTQYRTNHVPDNSSWGRQNRSVSWNLLNQNWQFKLVPSSVGLVDILAQSPGGWNDGSSGTGDEKKYVPPSLGNLTDHDIHFINMH
ncbi:MAG: hypothetical protein CBB70_10485 [Planctomycetaceae bacterium TMED10]|nr:MAG: hypothetical protein CBB70_10485 [Planctomycetaceae bacterium TMED10]